MPRFTAANAREMAARSVAARKAAEAKRTASLASPPLEATPSADNNYAGARLTRVRRQLDFIDAAIEAEASKKQPDGQRLDRLAAASMRLSDQEFALANRPKPGNRKPAPEPQRRHWEYTELHPVPLDPVPAEPTSAS